MPRKDRSHKKRPPPADGASTSHRKASRVVTPGKDWRTALYYLHGEVRTDWHNELTVWEGTTLSFSAKNTSVLCGTNSSNDSSHSCQKMCRHIVCTINLLTSMWIPIYCF